MTIVGKLLANEITVSDETTSFPPFGKINYFIVPIIHHLFVSELESSA